MFLYQIFEKHVSRSIDVEVGKSQVTTCDYKSAGVEYRPSFQKRWLVVHNKPPLLKRRSVFDSCTFIWRLFSRKQHQVLGRQDNLPSKHVQSCRRHVLLPCPRSSTSCFKNIFSLCQFLHKTLAFMQGLNFVLIFKSTFVTKGCIVLEHFLLPV